MTNESVPPPEPVAQPPVYPPPPHTPPPAAQPPYGSQPPQGEPPVYPPGYQPPAGQPPYGQPPYGQPPYAQPPKKSNQTLKIVLIVGGILLALCCVGAIIAGVFGVKAFKDATGPAKSAVTGYYDDLKKGNYGTAYDRLCADTKRSVSREDFTDIQNVLPRVTDYKVTGVNVSTNNGNVTGSVNVEVTRESVGKNTETVQLVKENGDWKVCQAGP